MKKSKNETPQERYDRLMIEQGDLLLKQEIYVQIIELILDFNRENSKSNLFTLAVSDVVFNLFDEQYKLGKELLIVQLKLIRMNYQCSKTDETNTG